MFAPLLSLAGLFSADVAPLTVRVDSTRHEVILTLGPFHLAASPTRRGRRQLLEPVFERTIAAEQGPHQH